MQHRISGFTLLELTMVLFILGLLLSSFLVPLAVRVEQQKRDNTQIQLDEIKETLYGYVLRYAHLPCPDCSAKIENCATVSASDKDDGEEDILVNTCATEIGNLPWATLGVQGVDAWNNRFTYRVTNTFADRGDATTDGTQYVQGPPKVQKDCENITKTASVSFSLCSDGEMKVIDAAGGSNIASFIPAIVISHGKNGLDDNLSADEKENIDNDIIFVDKDYSQAVDAGFDDMLIWISPHILRTMSVRAGLLP